MRNIIRQVGDHLLRLALPPVEAGACVPEHGQCCSRRGYRFDCNGICRRSTQC